MLASLNAAIQDGNKEMSYEPRKAAQLIAALLLHNHGQPLNVVKVIKLVYLIDRESIKQCGFPVLDEPHYSMPHGPVNSYTLNFINGEVPPEKQKEWREFISARADHEVGLARPDISIDDLGDLSEADLSFIYAVWRQYGHRNEWDIVRWMHDPRNIPEWHDPRGSSKLISFCEIAKAVGIENFDAVAEQYEQTLADDDAFKQAAAL